MLRIRINSLQKVFALRNYFCSFTREILKIFVLLVYLVVNFKLRHSVLIRGRLFSFFIQNQPFFTLFSAFFELKYNFNFIVNSVYFEYFDY